MIDSHPLERFPLLRTTSIEEVREAFARIYAKPKFEPDKNVRELNTVANHFELGHVGLHYNKYGAGVNVEFPEADYFLQIFSVKGQGEVVIDKIPILLTRGNSAAISPEIGYKAHWDADFERLVLKIRSNALMKKFIAMTGASMSRPLRINPVSDAARRETQFLRDSFLFLVKMISACPTPLPNFLLAELEQAVMVAFLEGNQHNYSHLLDSEPRRVAPSQVHRAEEYIKANWNQPIRIEDIAIVVGASARSVFRAFRNCRGYSPMEFVKQERLRQARKMLDLADPNTTVTHVALECGFGDLSNFSRDYRRNFGEPPSETLSRALGVDRTKVGASQIS